MSTLKTNTLSNTAGTLTVPTDTVVQGTAKAWVNFNGTGTVAIRAAFNVSSITDLGNGYYGINFTSALADVNYAVKWTSSLPENFMEGTTAPTTTAVRVVSSNSVGANSDPVYGFVAIFR